MNKKKTFAGTYVIYASVVVFDKKCSTFFVYNTCGLILKTSMYWHCFVFNTLVKKKNLLTWLTLCNVFHFYFILMLL